MNNDKEKNEIQKIQIQNNETNKEEKLDEDNKENKEKNFPNIKQVQSIDYKIKKSEKNNKINTLKIKRVSFKSQQKPNKLGLKLPSMKLSYNNKVNNLKINSLFGLEPFFSEFNNNMDKKGKEILREIASDYKEEKFEYNKIIYRYGDEADKFYIIYNGEVSLYFPFSEIIDMNIDEFYIYILRLRRYNEIEMLNNVLLLNKGEFMKEFNEGSKIDEYIYKLYSTYLKLKFDPTFLNQHEENRKRKEKIKVNNSDELNKNIQNNSKVNDNNLSNKKSDKKELDIYRNINTLQARFKFIIEDEEEIDINIFNIFHDREIKELLLRIGDELIETMKWIMPEKMYAILEEKDEDLDEITKKIINIPKILLKKYKELNPDNVNEDDYWKRILPPKRHNNNLISKKIIIMKYLYIDTLKKGQTFGDFNPDSLSLFSHSYLDIVKSSIISVNMHKFHNFRNMTVISTINHSEEISINNKLHLLYFNRKIYNLYFRKYIERINFDKKEFLLKNPLFLKTENKNLIKTYSICFKEKKIGEGEYIISENDKLYESNIYISFIIDGEYQSNCNKSISQIDEIIKQLGGENNIKNTYSQSIKNIIGTSFYEELIRRQVNFKLNFLNKNDIIGLTEILKNDKYFNNVQCTSNEGKVYRVDARIIKLLVDSDPIINKNKNIIVYNKYQMLSDILLKQRKIFFESFLNIEKNNYNSNYININEDRNSFNINFIKNNTINSNYKILPKLKNIMTSLESNFSSLSNFFQPQNSNFFSSQSLINKKNTSQISSLIGAQSSYQKKEQKLHDIDLILVNLRTGFTLKDLRNEKSLEFRKKYKEKIEKEKIKN